MMQTTQNRSPARAANDPDGDPLISTFMDLDAVERRHDPHEAAQRLCAGYANDLEASRKKPRRYLWIRGFVVIGLAIAILWVWPYVVRSLW